MLPAPVAHISGRHAEVAQLVEQWSEESRTRRFAELFES